MCLSKNRDTATINKILKDLTKHIPLVFQKISFCPTYQITKKIIGKWQIALYNVTFELRDDGNRLLEWPAWQSIQPPGKLILQLSKSRYNDNTMQYDLSVKRTTDDVLSLNNQIGGSNKGNGLPRLAYKLTTARHPCPLLCN